MHLSHGTTAATTAISAKDVVQILSYVAKSKSEQDIGWKFEFYFRGENKYGFRDREKL